MKHLRYLSYVLRHKWFVFRAGRVMEAPLWRLLIHDWSKFTPAEWLAYVNTFYDKKNAVPQAFDLAWLHHQHKNPHHWQHWVLRKDDGGLVALPMPTDLAREMVADWMGAGRAITGKWEVSEWYWGPSVGHGARDKMVLHPSTQEYVEFLIEERADLIHPRPRQ